MLHGILASVIIIIGLAYVILALANKESGNMKIGGQIIAALVLIVAVAILYHGYFGGRYGANKGCEVTGGKSGMMMEMMKKDPSIMQDLCKDRGMRDMMKKNMMKYGK
jgi:hypothetical protein